METGAKPVYTCKGRPSRRPALLELRLNGLLPYIPSVSKSSINARFVHDELPVS